MQGHVHVKMQQVAAKINSHKEKQNYKQTHIPVDISLQQLKTH